MVSNLGEVLPGIRCPSRSGLAGEPHPVDLPHLESLLDFAVPGPPIGANTH